MDNLLAQNRISPAARCHMTGCAIRMAKKVLPVQTPDDEPRISLTLRLPRSTAERLEAHILSQRFPPTKQLVIERLLEEFLDSQEVAAG